MTAGGLPKLIVILGPTASGKTDLGIELAKQFNGEIISADSRQVYKKMTVATGKPIGDWREIAPATEAYVVNDVPHHIMDMIDPGQEFTLADFKQLALAKVADITARGKVPFLVGGTGLYLWSVIDNLDIPAVPPNKKLRQGLEEKPLAQLVELLKKLDPASAATVDLKNPRRVLRALEVVIMTGQSFADRQRVGPPQVRALQIGLSWGSEQLRQRIEARIKEQLQNGFAAETEQLEQQRYAWNLPSMSGIGYKDAASFLRGELTASELERRLVTMTWRYAKRQLTWFKTNGEIQWLEAEKAREQARALIADFL